MKKINLIVLLCLTIVLSAAAQEYKKVYLGVGGIQSHFQDKKFSASQFRGIGGSFELGKDKLKENSLSGFNLRVNISSEYPHGYSKYTQVIRPSLNYYRLKKVNDRLFIGGNWTVADFYFRSTDGLENNSKYLDFSSRLAGLAIYDLKLGSKTLRASFRLGLIGLSKMTNSFAYAANQITLENGHFSFQDESIDSPVGKEGLSFKPLWKDFHLNTEINYPLSRRFDLVYQWELRRYAVVKNYSTTYGNNTLSIRFNFIHK